MAEPADTGSNGVRSYRKLAMYLTRNAAAVPPATMPSTPSVTASRRIIVNTCPRPAPSAMRTPISGTRLATLAAMTP